jgi:two-component system cell cycle response regulator
MPNKILTVDDSKTVRAIIRKTFKAFDAEIFEAGDGVEGLAVAAKTMPDLILLDITMPLMDGVEMLAKLKASPQLKGIPVMMLTAEGGKDNILKIAKMGIRDYIVKPFKEEVLIDKVARIVELKPSSEGGTKARSLSDAATILVVDDKPAIVQQIRTGLKHTPWAVQDVNTQGAAIDFLMKAVPDLIIISLSLPEESAFNLFRTLRASPKTKYTPIFGLVVKTDTGPMQQAQNVGFTTLITKPIDLVELETKVAKAMNLDVSGRYFSADGDILVFHVPEQCTPAALAEINTYLKPKLTDAVDCGNNHAIIDVRLVKALDMGIIKLLMGAMQSCRDLGVQFVLVGNPQIISDCKGFEETAAWVFLDSIEAAKAKFGVPAGAAA